MKDSKRKFYSVALILSLIFTLFSPAFAFADTNQNTKYTDFFDDDDHNSHMEKLVKNSQSLLEKTPELGTGLRSAADDGDEEVSVIVQMSKAPVALAEGAQKIQRRAFGMKKEKNAITKITEQQKKLIKDMNEDDVSFTKHQSYNQVLNGMAITVNAGDLDKLLNMDGVISVDPDEEMHALELPQNDEEAGAFMDDSVPHLGIPDLWDDGVTGENVKVAVLDTGIDYDHPDFDGVYKGGYNFVEHDDDYNDDRAGDDPYETSPDERPEGVPEFDDNDNPYYTSHGTHVAGTIAAQGDNDYDIRGIAPDVDLYAYRVLGAYGSGASSSIIKAIDRAVEKDMDIINLSLGGGSNSQTSPDAVAINNAEVAGVTPVIATGNSGPGRGTIGTPSTSALGIAVGNTTLPEATYDAHLQVEAADFEEEYDAELMAWEFGTDPDDDLSGEFDVAAVPDWGEEADYDDIDVDGKVALVSRGEVPFVDKIFAAEEAGAAGIMIHNNEGDGPSDVALGENFDFIPSFDLSTEDGEAFREAIAASDENTGTVTISDYEKGETAGGEINETSSQGPTTPTFDIKPDVVAPGTNIMSTVPAYGKYEDDADYDSAYDSKSGTSMATPHVAGIAALILSENPDFEPHDVKVALSNTAKQLDEEEYDVFSQGSGLVQPEAAVNPGTLAYAQDSTKYPDNDGMETEEDYEKGTVTFGRVSPDPDAETTVTKEIEVRDLAGDVSDYDVDVEVTKEAGGDLADASVSVDEESFTLDGSETLDITLTVPEGEDDLGNEMLGYIHLTGGSDDLSLPFAVEFSDETPTGLEYFYTDDEAIAPNGEGTIDETELNFSLYDDQMNVIFEVWSATEPGPAGDNYIGYIDGGNVPAGSYLLPIDGKYMPWDADEEDVEEEDMPDGVYSIDFNALDMEVGDVVTMDFAPLIVKTSEPSFDLDAVDTTDGTEHTVTGTIDDKFIDFKELYEEAFEDEDDYDVNEYISAEYELLADDDVVDDGEIALDDDGSFETDLSGLESDVTYTFSIDTEDAVGITGESETEFTVPTADVELTPSTTDYTVDPVTIDVDADDETTFTELKWLTGDKSAGEVAEEGTEILDDQSFDVSENGTYTVYAKDENDLEGTESIEITNITDPVDISLSPETTDYTVDPVMIDVTTDSEVDLKTLKWLAGEKDIDDFENNGNDILETGAFEATKNRTYTVYAENEYGIKAVQTITIDNITDPVEVSLTSSTDELSEAPVEVSVEVDSAAELTDLKMLKGDAIAEDIDKNGSDILDDHAFEVEENDVYSVLAKNSEGIYDVETIVVDNIQNEINLFMTPDTVDSTKGPVSITIETDSLSDLTALEWMKGNKQMDDFEAGQGNDILDTEAFEASENDIYTVYAENEEGIETVNRVSVDNIVKPLSLGLSQSETDETYGPVTVDVDVSTEAEIESLRFMSGGKSAEDFADGEGNSIDREANAFSVDENGTYTVYARTDEGNVQTSVVEVTNLLEKEDEVTASSDPRDGVVTVTDEDVEKLDDEGTFVVDLDDAISVDVAFSDGQVQALREKDASLIVRNNDVDMDVALANLPTNEDITIGVHQGDDEKDAVSRVYDLTISADGEEINKFTVPVQLSFQVDTDKVDDADALDVRYYDESKEEWVVMEDTRFDDGKMNINAKHFTKFGVFEMTDEAKKDGKEKKEKGETATNKKDNCNCGDDDGDDGSGVGDGSGGVNGTGGNNGNSGARKNVDNGKNNSSGNTGKTNGSNAKQPTPSANGKTSGTDETDSGNGDKLPSTATPMYNIMLIGAILLIIGSLTLYIYRKKNKSA